MRDPDQRSIALECVELAMRHGGEIGDVLLAAEQIYEFVVGDDSARKLAEVREVVSR